MELGVVKGKILSKKYLEKLFRFIMENPKATILKTIVAILPFGTICILRYNILLFLLHGLQYRTETDVNILRNKMLIPYPERLRLYKWNSYSDNMFILPSLITSGSSAETTNETDIIVNNDNKMYCIFGGNGMDLSDVASWTKEIIDAILTKLVINRLGIKRNNIIRNAAYLLSTPPMKETMNLSNSNLMWDKVWNYNFNDIPISPGSPIVDEIKNRNEFFLFGYSAGGVMTIKFIEWLFDLKDKEEFTINVVLMKPFLSISHSPLVKLLNFFCKRTDFLTKNLKNYEEQINLFKLFENKLKTKITNNPKCKLNFFLYSNPRDRTVGYYYNRDMKHMISIFKSFKHNNKQISFFQKHHANGHSMVIEETQYVINKVLDDLKL